MSDALFFAGLKVFNKTKDNFIHAEEINAICNHHGPIKNVPLIEHPRPAHNLLGYSLDITTFKPRTSTKLWAGGEWPDWKIRYKLFKRFGIVNARLLREDTWRVARRERRGNHPIAVVEREEELAKRNLLLQLLLWSANLLG